VAQAMTAGLDPGELRQLEAVCLKLATTEPNHPDQETPS